MHIFPCICSFEEDLLLQAVPEEPVMEDEAAQGEIGRILKTCEIDWLSEVTRMMSLKNGTNIFQKYSYLIVIIAFRKDMEK